MKNIILGVLAVLILGGVGFWYMAQEQEKELETFANNEEKVTEKVEMKTYTMNDVAVHNSKNNCWMVINGEVIDVTSFISKHPGGDRILEGCGIDATSLFKKVPGHNSGIAKMLLNKLKVGTLSN